MSKWFYVILKLGIVAALLSCCGCFPTSDYSIDLPKGYSINRTMHRTVSLADVAGWEVVAPDIDKYRVIDKYRYFPVAIVGHVSKHPDPYFKSVPGYFILDLKTGNAYQGLSEKDWVNRLQKYGIRSVPKLINTRD